MGSELAPLGSAPEPPATAAPAGAPIDLLGLALVGLAETSIAGYLKDLRAFAEFAGGGAVEAKLWRLVRLEPGTANALVLAWVAEMLGRKLSPATIRRRVAALARVVRAARRVGLTGLEIDVDLPRAEAFRDTAGPGARGWRKMLDLLMNLAAGGGSRARRDLAIVLLLHDRALRREEVAGLDYPDDFDRGRPAVQVRGKGHSAKEWLTINDRTRDAIARWVEARGDHPGPLFTRADNARGQDQGRLLGESINRLVKRLGIEAEIERRVRAHGLRHQAITEALDAGYDVRDVRHFSRHAKIDTVLIYDDRRKDLGGEITRAIGGKGRRRRAPG